MAQVSQFEDSLKITLFPVPESSEQDGEQLEMTKDTLDKTIEEPQTTRNLPLKPLGKFSDLKMKPYKNRKRDTGSSKSISQKILRIK